MRFESWARRSGRGAVVFVMVGALVACGSDGDTGTSPDEAALASETTVTPVESSTTTTSSPPATSTTAAPGSEVASDEEQEHDDAGMHEEEAAHDDDSTHDEGDMHREGEVIPETAGPADRTVEIVMTDFAFDPDLLVVSSGETIEFVLRNDGVIEHEFRLSTQHRVDEHLAAGHDHGSEGHHEAQDVIVLIAAGEERVVDVTFPDPETYTVVACLIPGHYEAGMWGDIRYS